MPWTRWRDGMRFNYPGRLHNRKRKPRKPFPASTTGKYLPGVGMTLTRANVEEVEARRQEAHRRAKKMDQYQPLGSEEMAKLLLSRGDGYYTPTARHLGRMYVLNLPRERNKR